MTDTTTKKSGRGVRLSPAEKIAKYQKLIAEAEAQEARERAANDPELRRYTDAVDRLRGIQKRANSTINGHGRSKGKGAAARIAKLEAEITDIRFRIDRDAVVLPVVAETISAIEAALTARMDGKDADFPTLPDCLHPDNYKLSDMERDREVTNKSAKERGFSEKDENVEPVTESSDESDENDGDN